MDIIICALKTPRILSFLVVHHILAGIILLLSFAFTPAASRLFKASETFLGMVQEMPLRFKKIYSCSVHWQCRNRWFTISNASPQRKQLEHKVIPLFFKLSWVRAASLANNHIKHEILWGILLLHICFHGQLYVCRFVWSIKLWAELTLNPLFYFPSTT